MSAGAERPQRVAGVSDRSSRARWLAKALVRHEADLNGDDNAQEERLFEQGRNTNVGIDRDERVPKTETDDRVGAREDGRDDHRSTTLHDSNALV